MDVVTWVIFTVIVQMIHPHVLDVVMLVIFSVPVPGSEMAQSKKSRQGNSDINGENVYAAAFTATVG